MVSKKIPLTIYLTEVEMRQVARLADRSERSRSDFARRVLLSAMQGQEDQKEGRS